MSATSTTPDSVESSDDHRAHDDSLTHSPNSVLLYAGLKILFTTVYRNRIRFALRFRPPSVLRRFLGNSLRNSNVSRKHSNGYKSLFFLSLSLSRPVRTTHTIYTSMRVTLGLLFVYIRHPKHFDNIRHTQSMRLIQFFESKFPR